MTTDTKHFGHGTRACYVRGCRRDECRAAHYRYMSRIRLEHHRGHRRRTSATQTRVHVERLLAHGWTQAKVARAAGVRHRCISSILDGQPTVSKRIAIGILSIPVGPPTSDDRDVDATGTIRRIRALIAIGYSGAHIAQVVDLYPTALHRIARGELAKVRAVTATRVSAAYRRLGQVPGPSIRARNDAVRNGWAPPAAWDDDTIDDPNAHPDWTGFCGSDRGWWTHRMEKIPVCRPCQAAHDEWLQERKHLSPADRYRALGMARGEASNRGAAIAEDARELMRLGADYETAAARIGITRNHLQQELLRHPLQTAA